MRTLFKAVLATVALAAPFYANAVPITWTYSGQCDGGACDVVPTITGELSGNPGAFGPSNELNDYFFLFGDLTSYSFNVGGYELGLDPNEAGQQGLGGAVPYWGVADAAAAHARLVALGAVSLGPVQDVGEGIRVAILQDPFGNALGIIENPHFTLP